MDRIREFVIDIADKVAQMGISDLVSHGHQLPLNAAVIIKLGLDELSTRFADIVGSDKLEAFYAGCQAYGKTVAFHLSHPMANTVPAYCYLSETGSISIDTEGLYAALKELADCVAIGKMKITLSLRLVNFDIANETELADGMLLRKISESTLVQKYPIERQLFPISPMLEQHWSKHRVELVVHKEGTPAEVEQLQRIEVMHAFINSILHSFLLADVPHKSKAFVTHLVLSSPLSHMCYHQGQRNVVFEPHVLSEQELDRVRQTFQLLKVSSNDRVLETAIDRFVLGRKRDTHHPNRVNQPNWDKIVDYVIALETLFLTVENNAMAQELAYRFRLNGTSLLTRAIGGQPQSIFEALKNLYELRSKVVHGSGDAKVLKAANKFIEALGIDRDQHKHGIGRIMIVSEKVEEWITALFFVLSEMPIDRRPYREKHGWENMLWAKYEGPVSSTQANEATPAS